MQMTEVAGYVQRTFMDPAGSGLPSPDVVLGVVFTGLSFGIGWMASRSGSQRRLKARVINELILSQSELRARAYPKVWREDDLREAWMLDPFVARLRFLYSSLNEAKSLKGKQLSLIEAYIQRVEEFIALWSETRRRKDAYHEAYNFSYRMMRSAAKSLGLRETSRFAGLASPKDDLFASLPMAAQPSPAPAAGQRTWVVLAE